MLDSESRREKIRELLFNESSPVSASAIAERFGVSRQVIVGDIALLRAQGALILATPRGYITEKAENEKGKISKTIACCHDTKRILEELYTILDLGGEIVDVTVEHSVYGQISAPLHVFSRFDADLFWKKINLSGAKPLCDLTQGVHLHKILVKSESDFQRIKSSLLEKGILIS